MITDQPWITTGIKQSIKRNRDLYSKYLKCRTNEDKYKWKIYKTHYYQLPELKNRTMPEK